MSEPLGSCLWQQIIPTFSWNVLLLWLRIHRPVTDLLGYWVEVKHWEKSQAETSPVDMGLWGWEWQLPFPNSLSRRAMRTFTAAQMKIGTIYCISSSSDVPAQSEGRNDCKVSGVKLGQKMETKKRNSPGMLAPSGPRFLLLTLFQNLKSGVLHSKRSTVWSHDNLCSPGCFPSPTSLRQSYWGSGSFDG